MSRVFIGVGSNEGERLAQISKAIRLLGSCPGTHLAQLATISETAPVGGPPQGPYLNTVVEAETTLSPSALLAVLQEIERRVGRVPSAQRWSPRPIDLDILFYDLQIINEPTLIVPHPRLHERQFVLEPLAQLAPDFVHPVLHRSITQLCEELLRRSLMSQ